MQVIVFNGIKYYKYKNGYYQASETAKRKRDGIEKRLHRAIWKFYNGDIPKGMHIHHKDENKDNNDISNLELLTASEHRKKHNHRLKDWWHSKAGIRANKKGIRMAKLWHASKEGYIWHSEHQKQTMKKHTVQEVCKDCGCVFNTLNTIRHQDLCRKCRDKILKREIRKKNKLATSV